MLPRTSTGRQGPRNALPLLAALPPVSETPCHTVWVHNAECSFFLCRSRYCHGLFKRIAVAPWTLRAAADDTITHTLCMSLY